MSEMTPETVRDFIRRELQKARLARRTEEAIAIEEAMANSIASAWEADQMKAANIIVEQQTRIEAAIAAIESEGDPDAPGRPWLIQHILGILRGDAALAAHRPEVPSRGERP
jgi:hypothetical protein